MKFIDSFGTEKLHVPLAKLQVLLKECFKVTCVKLWHRTSTRGEYSR